MQFWFYPENPQDLKELNGFHLIYCVTIQSENIFTEI